MSESNGSERRIFGTFAITWSDIWNGERGDPERCAAARAIERGTGLRVEVADESVPCVLFPSSRGPVLVSMPLNLIDFVQSYDSFLGRFRVRPITFELALTKVYEAMREGSEVRVR